MDAPLQEQIKLKAVPNKLAQGEPVAIKAAGNEGRLGVHSPGHRPAGHGHRFLSPDTDGPALHVNKLPLRWHRRDLCDGSRPQQVVVAAATASVWNAGEGGRSMG